jgi:hypothetical protein
MQDILNVQPVIPIHINPDWTVITRTILPLVWQPSFQPAQTVPFGTGPAQPNPVTAIDIALEPDAAMMQHAKAANERLRQSFPEGFALDATHHPHVTLLQQFVRTDDFDKVFTAANAVLTKAKPTTWTLKAFKY